MRNSMRLRIQAAGRFTPPVGQLSVPERTLVFRAVQTVIEADGFLAQPGADMLVSLRAELGLESVADLGDELTGEELGEMQVSGSTADYLIYMVTLAALADGVISDSERRVLDDFGAALSVDPARRQEILTAGQRALLEANLVMNLPEVITASPVAEQFCKELGLEPATLEDVAESILQSFSEA